MFSEPTVFVLGAGVSQPFGFPSGVGLIDAICKNNSTRENRLVQLLKMADEGRSESFIKEFIQALNDSELSSIDAWLEGNPKYMTLGKCAIAAVIWDAEHHAVTKAVSDHDNWFRWLWNKMYTPDINELGNNTVKFITFNYDRLLEYKLLKSINGTYMQCGERQKSEVFQGLLQNIIHVHGELHAENREYSHIGADTWSADLTLTDAEQASKEREDGKRIAYFAKSIHIVSEKRDEETKLEFAKEWLMKATKRVFLGFGYDPRNLERLGVRQLVQSGIEHAKGAEVDIVGYPVVGTAYNLELGEQIMAKDIFAHRVHFGENDYNAVRFCRKYVKVPNIKK